VIDVQTTITLIHHTSRHDTIVYVMFTQLFYLSMIAKLRHPDTVSSLMRYIDWNLFSTSIIIFVCCLSLRGFSLSHSPKFFK
jgi:hypothetical protein